jgi:hypothetical protein
MEVVAEHDQATELHRRDLERAAEDSDDDFVEASRVGPGSQECSSTDHPAGDLDEDSMLVLG